MFEQNVQFEIDLYIRNLGQELDVQGLSPNRIEEIVREARCHLDEAMECAGAKNATDARRVLAEFGKAKRMAAQHGAEMNRPRKEKFLWPAAVLLFLMTFHEGFWTTHIWHYVTVSLWVGSALFFWFGFRGRKPIVSQFVVCMVAFVAVQTAWNTALTVPTVFTSGEILPVGIREVEHETALLQQTQTKLEAGVTEIQQGMRLFTESNKDRAVPSTFRYGTGYWVPEGIRELQLSIPASELHPSLHVGTWEEAVKEWTGKGNFAGPVDAIRISRADQSMIRSGFENLAWIQHQPITVRAAIAYIASLRRAGVYLALALVTANSGWLFWQLTYLLRVSRRRRGIQARFEIG